MFLVLVGTVLTLPFPAPFQTPDPWIGCRVFTQYGTVLKVGNNVVDDEGRVASLKASGKDSALSRVYRVEHTNGESDIAIADYNEAIRLDPKDAAPCNSRAWLWATCSVEAHRDGKRAVESVTMACELNEWKKAYDLDTLAAAYADP